MGSAKAKASKENCAAKKAKAKTEFGACRQCGEKGNCPDDKPDCILLPYRPDCCPNNKTGHHVIPKHCFIPTGGKNDRVEGCAKYNPGKAPCVCLTGKTKVKNHGKVHDSFDPMENLFKENGRPGAWPYLEAKNAACFSLSSPPCNCPQDCIGPQLDKYHKEECGMDDDTLLIASSSGGHCPLPAVPKSSISAPGPFG
jgi:GHH signature containing HNH/Endo VII superfamily nuclease toxin  2